MWTIPQCGLPEGLGYCARCLLRCQSCIHAHTYQFDDCHGEKSDLTTFRVAIPEPQDDQGHTWNAMRALVATTSCRGLRRQQAPLALDRSNKFLAFPGLQPLRNLDPTPAP